MKEKLFWQTEGEGPDLVLIHGWGMNGAVWQQVVPELSKDYRVHTVDLPGYGNSATQLECSLDSMAQRLLEESPQHAIWMGWSLGGLIAKQAALIAPSHMRGLITVASSPRFAAEHGWRGIKPEVLSAFTEQLDSDFQSTIERFMALQAMGSATARQDIKWLKSAVLSRPTPNPEALAIGLDILANADLREQVRHISMPWLRLYGRLDGLVPVKVADELDVLVPASQRQVFAKASHAPFISDPKHFVETVMPFLASVCRPVKAT